MFNYKKVISSVGLWMCIAVVAWATVEANESVMEKGKVGKPDLVVSKIKAKQVRGKSKAEITYTIKNQGTAASKSSTATLLPAKGKKVIKQNVPPLKPGDTFQTTVTYDFGMEGKYEVKATADYMNTNREIKENNNENTLRISIGRVF